MADDSKTYWTKGEVALHLRVTVRTVERWIAKGSLKTYRTFGGQIRICAADAKLALEKHDEERYTGERRDDPAMG